MRVVADGFSTHSSSSISASLEGGRAGSGLLVREGPRESLSILRSFSSISSLSLVRCRVLLSLLSSSSSLYLRGDRSLDRCRRFSFSFSFLALLRSFRSFRRLSSSESVEDNSVEGSRRCLRDFFRRLGSGLRDLF